jgi:hypothetical protein
MPRNKTFVSVQIQNALPTTSGISTLTVLVANYRVVSVAPRKGGDFEESTKLVAGARNPLYLPFNAYKLCSTALGLSH